MHKRISTNARPLEQAALGLAEAAAFLGVGRTLVFSLLRDGSLTQLKAGRRTLIPRASLQAFLDRASRRPAPREAA